MLTPDLQERICALIRDKGMYPSRAAVACGISESTFYELLARGRPGNNGQGISSISSNSSPEAVAPGTRGRGDDVGLYAEFAEVINKADADLEVMVITDAVAKFKKSKNPLAPIIFASRRFRERWSEQIQVTAAGKEALASMERLKAAWDAPEVVDGVYTELPDDGTRPKLPEATGSENKALPNQSEAKGFHVPPPDLVLDTDPDTEDPDTDQDPQHDASQDGEPGGHVGRGDNEP